MHVSIVSAGLGNVKSVKRMIEYVGGSAEIVDDPVRLEGCEALALPGVGAFDHGMTLLHHGGWVGPINNAALQRRVPVLGICLGMQLMCRKSEEGQMPGLNWIAADVRRVDTQGSRKLKVPHVGWSVTTPKVDNDIFPYGEAELRYYYVHSYRAVCDDMEDVLSTATYGDTFVSAIRNANLRGVQFHPEKSHRFGMALFERFLAL